MPQPTSSTWASSIGRTRSMAAPSTTSGPTASFSSSYVRGCFQMFGLGMASPGILGLRETIPAAYGDRWGVAAAPVAARRVHRSGTRGRGRSA
ncbi:hypothetical protein BJF83_04340 [Nocardiopsis sp. CNR-923]|nr:hypothetical protein BJF83_04340 [Nocardiopsis sp. CNR-923]